MIQLSSRHLTLNVLNIESNFNTTLYIKAINLQLLEKIFEFIVNVRSVFAFQILQAAKKNEVESLTRLLSEFPEVDLTATDEVCDQGLRIMEKSYTYVIIVTGTKLYII